MDGRLIVIRPAQTVNPEQDLRLFGRAPDSGRRGCGGLRCSPCV